MATVDFNVKYFDLEQNRKLEIVDNPKRSLEIIVVIPAFKEPAILSSIQSLLPSSLIDDQYEIFIILNHPEDASSDEKAVTKQAQDHIEEWIKSSNMGSNKIKIFSVELPNKFAGVGLARKIGMDAAAYRFMQIHKPQGVIMTYDADCDCKEDHVQKVHSYFKENTSIQAASIHYEHPYQTIGNKTVRRHIVDYELHLRAYVEWKKQIGLPYAYQTIGSSMAVRAASYTRKGGMNKRKAGEDFYFLHKFTHDDTFGEINTTTVFPSCRVSDRVPFGTGRAMQEAIDLGREMHTYNPQSFLLMEKLVKGLETVYIDKNKDKLQLDSRLLTYLESINFDQEIEVCFNNSASLDSFKKRFFHSMDAFQMMKYLHYMRDYHFPNVEPLASANELFALINIDRSFNAEDALLKMRSNA